MTEQTYLLLRHREVKDIDRLEIYRQQGGFNAFQKMVKSMSPEMVINEVLLSGLKGRGGAAFPTGQKWRFIPKEMFPHYVVANADESEPGAFKDREIIEGNPYQFLEGLMIASFAVRSHLSFIYMRGEFWGLAQKLDACIAELEKNGLLGENLFGSTYSLRLCTHLGGGAYICGDETALLESLEGKLGQPRLKPPFPATVGLYGSPTVINNVETLTNIPLIIEKGGNWYSSLGVKGSEGVKIFSLSGCVQNPGNYELPLGTTFRHLIYGLGGGPVGGRKVKAILTAGASSSIIAVNDDAVLDTPMDYDLRRKLGAPLGSASIIVADDSINIAWLVQKTLGFFKHESCGKCTPCRESTYWMADIINRIVSGAGKHSDIKKLKVVAQKVLGKTLCPLGDFAISAALAGLEKFPGDFEALIKEPLPQGKIRMLGEE